MPLTIKTGRMKYKDGQGDYQPIDAVGQGDVVSLVEDWMDENISGASGEVVIDSSLSVSGAAADAEIVGDEIARVETKVNDRPNVLDSDAEDADLDVADENGNVILRLEDGQVKTKNFDSSDIGDLSELETTEKGTLVDAINEIDEAIENMDVGQDVPRIMTSTGSMADLDITDPSGNVILRLQNGHVQTKEFDSSSVMTTISQIESMLGDESTAPIVLSSSNGLNIVRGEYCDPQTGVIYDGSSFSSFVRSDYLPVSPGDIVRATWCRHYVFFNPSKTYVSGGDISALPDYIGTQEENFITIPSGVAYLIVNYYAVYDTYGVTLDGTGDPEVVILGDSIYGIAPYPFNPVYYAAKELKMNIADCAFGGTTASVHYDSNYDKFSFHNIAGCIVSGDFSSMADFSGMPSIFKQHRATLSNIDWSEVKVVCLAWCTNDWDFGINLDDETNKKNKNRFLGALRYGMETIWSEYPHIQFVLFGALYKTVTNQSGHDSDSAVNTHGKTLREYIDGMKSVAEEYHQNFFDHYNIGFNSINAGVVFRPDGVHLSYDVGAAILGKRTAKEIELVLWGE